MTNEIPNPLVLLEIGILKQGVKGLDLSYSGKSSMSRWQGGLAKHLAKHKRKHTSVNPKTNGSNANGSRVRTSLA